jgi:hypothetical protein
VHVAADRLPRLGDEEHDQTAGRDEEHVA